MNKSGILIATLLIASAVVVVISGAFEPDQPPSTASSAGTTSPGPADEMSGTDPALDPAASGRSDIGAQYSPDAASRRLVGVIGTEEETERRALIESAQGIQTMYRIGEQVPPDQAILEEVHHNRALLRRADDELITLYRQGKDRAEVATIKSDAPSSFAPAHEYHHAESTQRVDQATDADDAGAVTGQPEQRAAAETCDEAATGREAGACEAAVKRRRETEENKLAQAAGAEQAPAMPGNFPGADQDFPGSSSAPDQPSPAAETGSDRDTEGSIAASPAPTARAGSAASPAPATEPEMHDGRE